MFTTRTSRRRRGRPGGSDMPVRTQSPRPDLPAEDRARLVALVRDGATVEAIREQLPGADVDQVRRAALEAAGDLDAELEALASGPMDVEGPTIAGRVRKVCERRLALL